MSARKPWEPPRDQIYGQELFPYGSYQPDIALKPCPFCSGQAAMKKTDRYPRYGKHEGERVDGYTVICVHLKCAIYDCDNHYKTSEKAAARIWNKRRSA